MASSPYPPRAGSPLPPEPAREPGLWKWAAAWMAFLGPWFFLAYGFCNWFTSTRSDVRQVWWEWERSIPFLPWFVVPYFSLDLFYAVAPFLCRTRAELNLLGRRLFTATTLSSVCFLLFPLEYGWPRPLPAEDSWTYPIFSFLHAGDMPYNMAPSLHISLRALLWGTYARHLRGRTRQVTKFWFIAIGFSTMLVGQHHFIDVVTGFLMAYAVLALLPDRAAPVIKMPRCAKSRTLARRYGAGAALLAIPACFGGGYLWFAWPALALGVIALAYATGDPRWWQKANGALTPSVEWMMLPFLAPAKMWQARWRRGAPQWHEITPGVFFGRRPQGRDLREFQARGLGAVLDLTPESTLPPFVRETCVWKTLPVLDLLPPPPAVLSEAVRFLRENADRRLLIICELGLSRSACAAAAWLLDQGRAATPEEAVKAIAALEPRAVLRAGHVETLTKWRESDAHSGCGKGVLPREHDG